MTEWDHPTAFSCWGKEERAAIARVIASDRYTMGQEVEALEREFAAFHGMKHGICVNSGSSANLIGIAALCAKDDKPLQRSTIQHPIADRVIVPAIAWSTTYAPLVQHGLDLILADVDAGWNSPVPNWFPGMNVRLVVACSILGNPAYLPEWKQIADRLGAYFMEDNCESLGAKTSDGRLCGTYGIVNTFSGFFSHQISGVELGIILSDDDECARLCRILRGHGWTRDVEKPQCFEEEYQFTHFGYNVRPIEMHAAVAREQLKKLPGFIEARRKNAALFREMTADLPITSPPWNGQPSPFGLHFTVADRETRSMLVQALRGASIDVRLPTGGSFRKHAYASRWANQATPQADALHDCGCFLGCPPWPAEDKIARVVEVMRRAL